MESLGLMYTLHTIPPNSGTCIHCGAILTDDDLKAISAGVYGVNAEGTICDPNWLPGEEYRDCRENGQLKLFVNT